MKLIYIVNVRIPTQMGHGYQITKMCESFALAGAEVELWAPTRENPIRQDAFDFYGLERNFVIREIKSFDWLKYVKYLGAVSFYLQSWWFFAKLLFIGADKEAIIYTRNPEIACIFKFRGFKKVAYECHEWFRRGIRLNLFYLRNIGHLITTNSFVKKEFVSRGFDDKKILAAPNGIDLNIFDLDISKGEAIEELSVGDNSDGRAVASPRSFLGSLPRYDLGGRTVLPKLKDKKILLYTGSLRLKGEKKGVDEILEAIKTLNNPEVVFVAVGGNEKDIAYYKQIADNLGMGKSVYFFLRQNQQNLALFQKIADILLMPFPDIAHYRYYMCPLKMLEYMASKRPIIASDLPSIREILNENNSVICKPGDTNDLAAKIKFLLDNHDLGQKLADRAREDVQQYVWTKRAERIIDFIVRA